MRHILAALIIIGMATVALGASSEDKKTQEPTYTQEQIAQAQVSVIILRDRVQRGQDQLYQDQKALEQGQQQLQYMVQRQAKKDEGKAKK